MKDNNLLAWNLFLGSLVQTVLVTCITIVSIRFNNVHVLWWYILPALMQMSIKSSKGDKDDNSSSNDRGSY